MAGRAKSSNHLTGNSYIRHQKQVRQFKKEQQFQYFMQKQRANKQLIDQLNKEYASNFNTKQT